MISYGSFGGIYWRIGSIGSCKVIGFIIWKVWNIRNISGYVYDGYIDIYHVSDRNMNRIGLFEVSMEYDQVEV